MMSVDTSKIPSATTKKSSASKSSSAKAVFLSPDFLIGVPAGFGLSLLPALVPSLIENGFAFFMTLAGIAAAVAALVLTPMTILMSALTPGLRGLLAKVPGGAAGTFVPFVTVAVIAAAACFTSLVVAILAPLGANTYPVVVWAVAGVPLSLFIWALIGCVQVTFFLVGLFRTAEKIEELQNRTEAAKKLAAGR